MHIENVNLLASKKLARVALLQAQKSEADLIGEKKNRHRREMRRIIHAQQAAFELFYRLLITNSAHMLQ